ncbi:MAG: isoprenylcysteine carboxylmethyltransferase family protein [Phycisphaerales bacterium]|nr:isoprenylcysteine carboxylmethyltransferase family protein [Phycisphaerales bacterium]
MSSVTTSASRCPFSTLRVSTGGGALLMAYGIVGYAAFLATILYAIGFVGNWVVPKSIDSGTVGPIGPSLLINALLLTVFVVQHTIMARPAFKRAWTRIIPPAAERSTFVLLASASLGLIFWQWRPLPQVVWEVSHPALAWSLSGLSLVGWAMVFGSSCLINHFDLFGLRQTWLAMRNEPYRPAGFKLVGLYRIVRHPLMLGFLIAFWATPTMTVGHLFFAVMTTLYIFFGTWIEERDLVAEHGEKYLAYRRSVRAFVPLPK